MSLNETEIIARLDELNTNTNAIFENLKWNAGGFFASAHLILHPEILRLENIPENIEFAKLEMSGPQCFGLALQPEEKPYRADELLTGINRMFVCDSLEIGADALSRAARLEQAGVDPYDSDDYYSVDIRELWNPNKGKAGSLMTDTDGLFFKDCAAPLRHLIRLNNSFLPPNKAIKYSGKPRQYPINVSFEWKKGERNNVALPLYVSHIIFDTTHQAVVAGLEMACSKVRERSETKGSLAKGDV